MSRTNASAGQHRDGSLRHHWHIKGNQIAFLNTKSLKGICSLANLRMQLAIAKNAGVTWLPLPYQCALISLGPEKMAIEAVVGNIGGAPLKPASKRWVAPIEHLLKWTKPVKFLVG